MDTGDTAWVLASAAMVLLMTPGLALFYGGMVRAKSVLNMMMMSFGALALISVLWVLYGYSEAFGNDVGAGLVGNPFEFFGLTKLMGTNGVDGGFQSTSLVFTIPSMAFVAFQAVFAIITVALISGAIADRARFGPWMLFSGIWATIVYFPVAHWVFAFDGAQSATGGWIANNLKAIDFAGGTAVHINAGAAGLALALVLGKRIGFNRDPMRPHNLTLVMAGAGLLWFGWFGFNAGSSLAANGLAAHALLVTTPAAAAATITWVLASYIHKRKVSVVGAACGAVAGLVAITPASGFVTAGGALAIGLAVGGICYGATLLRERLRVDDALDVFAVHGVGGTFGAIATGIFATTAITGVGGAAGLIDGKPEQVVTQLVAVGATIAYAVVMTFIIVKVVDLVLGIRVTQKDEEAGLDLSVHGEVAYQA